MKAIFTRRALPFVSRRAALSIVIGLSLVVLLIFSAPESEARDQVGKLPKDSVARHQITSLDGRQFSLAALRGQVVVLDFFAVWCSTSRAHLPSITRFTDDERQRGLQIIGLAVQERTTKEQLEQLMADQKIAYPVGWISDAAFSKYVDSRDVSVPQTLIYGRDGRLLAHFNGHSAEIDASISATIKRELEKK